MSAHNPELQPPIQHPPNEAIQPAAPDFVAALTDLNPREFLVLGALAIAVLAVGIWPAPLLEVMQSTTHHLAQQLLSTKLTP